MIPTVSAYTPRVPLVAKQKFIHPRQTLEAPDNFDAVIRDNWAGVRRIVVGALDETETETEKKSFPVINSFRIDGGGFELEPPEDEPEDAIAEVMAVITADLIKRGAKQAEYRIEVYPHTEHRKRAVPARATGTIAIGRLAGGVPDSHSIDLVVLNLLGQTTNHLWEQNEQLLEMSRILVNALDTERKHTDAKTRREITMLEKMELEIEDRARVRAETVEIDAMKEIEIAKMKRQDDFIDTIRPLIDTAVNEKAMDIARSGRKKRKPKTALSATKTDAKKTDDGDDGDELSAEDQALSREHPELFLMRFLWSELEDDQRAKAAEILGADRWQAVSDAAAATTNAACLELLRGALAEVTREETRALGELLDTEQMAVIAGLRLKLES